MSRINNKNKDKNHITSSNRKYNLALVDTYDIHKEYGILDEEEKYLKEKKDQVVPLKDVDNMIKLLCRFHICGIASDLEHFEDIVRDKVSTIEYMAELDDFGGYGSMAEWASKDPEGYQRENMTPDSQGIKIGYGGV